MTRVGIMQEQESACETEDQIIKDACVTAETKNGIETERFWMTMFGDEDLDLGQVERERLSFVILCYNTRRLSGNYVLVLAEKIVNRLKVETTTLTLGSGRKASPVYPIEVIGGEDREAAVKRLAECITKGSYLVSDESINKMTEVIEGLKIALKMAEHAKERHEELIKAIRERRKFNEEMVEYNKKCYVKMS